MTDVETFLERLHLLLGEPGAVHSIESTKHGLPPVYAFLFQDYPKEGFLTSVTYGLSCADHPDWKGVKPELILTLETEDESWALAAAFFAERFRGIKPFAYGNLFTLDDPISAESEMAGFFVSVPALLDQNKARIEMPGKVIYLMGLYPLYLGEVNLLRKIGLEKFWNLEALEPCNVNRPDLSLDEYS